ncbi:hypothetical protein [Sphingobacterium bovistauri]|uniref:Uncharacterized protein n=1 Tax=Sphingobacterium bovistauri TaxID=2781959 RepID=A0ABS7Z957_9SPHI|nr:hypothetical protein [Sphingobacterium bovistauri]MCA5006107.1 hypothetical protein [Sphingobacterium bovistauri]
MLYIPFEQVTIDLFHDLVSRGYKDFVLQKFEWPSVTFGKGFLLSAYENKELAHVHASELDVKEGKALHLPDDFEKIQKLLEVDSGYRIFLNKIKNIDWEKRMLKHYNLNIVNYLRSNTKFKRTDKIDILFTLEYGRVKAIIESNGTRKEVNAFDLIK